MLIKEAWRFLEEKWASPIIVTRTTGEKHAVEIGVGGTCCGLCGCLDALYTRGLLTGSQYDAMMKTIKEYRALHNIQGIYLWPCDAVGAVERAKFCKTQGEKC